MYTLNHNRNKANTSINKIYIYFIFSSVKYHQIADILLAQTIVTLSAITA